MILSWHISALQTGLMPSSTRLPKSTIWPSARTLASSNTCGTYAIDPDSSCVINKRCCPLLSHPITGVIFAATGGTDTFALRLPEPERSTMMAVPGYGAEVHYPEPSTTMYAKNLGDDWVLIKLFGRQNPDLCQRAYDYAGTLE
jgi:hypothetical protein